MISASLPSSALASNGHSPFPNFLRSVESRSLFTLTKEESQLFQILKDVQQFASIHDQTILRVAGGWVRDKILGIPSHDIDIALNNMMGLEMAQHVHEFLESKHGFTHSIGCIQRNPDRSKHLETATMRIEGYMVDFVNLRSECYTDDSRIPNVQFGTALEDAYRRDLTINSLFYNINFDCVEDWTGRGISDLINHFITTPLDPLQTFIDDPLRVMRFIRFASRLEFSIDPKLIEAGSNQDVIRLLEYKIARERIGIEFDAILTSKNPELGIKLISSMNLYPVIFKLPPNIQMPDDAAKKSIMYTEMAIKIYHNAAREISLPEGSYLADSNSGAKDHHQWPSSYLRYFIFASFLMPFADQEDQNNLCVIGESKKLQPLVKHILLESLKLTKRDGETIVILHQVTLKLAEILQRIQFDKTVYIDQLQLGRLLRQGREYYMICLNLAIIYFLSNVDHIIETHNDVNINLDPFLCRYSHYMTILIDSIRQKKLESIWRRKPYFNGNQIMKILKLSSGCAVGEILKEQMDWIIMNPMATAEDCQHWLVNSKFSNA